MTSDLLATTGLAWLWRASWQASVLVLLVLLAQWACRARLEPRWRFALWWLVLLRLALPLAPESAWSVFNWTPAAPLPSPLPQREIVIPPSPTLPTIPTPAFPNLELAPISHPMISRTQPPPKPAPRSSPWSLLAWVWLAGTGVYGGRILLGTYLISRRLKRHTPLRTPEILEVLEACSRDMGVARAPEVWVTTAVDSPALFGLWRCRLLVPPHLPDTFSPAEWRHVFRHELAHLRRRDPQINGLMLLLQTAHWFNPLVWLAMRRMRADRELACDAAALACAPAADARAYGDTILKLLADSARPAFTPSLVGILEDKSLIKQRIRQIAGFKPTRRWPILAATLLASLCVFAMTDAQSPSPVKFGEQKAADEMVPAPEASKTASTNQELSLKAAEIQPERVNVNTLVQDGRVLLESNKLDEAEQKLEQAFKEDPNNATANYYLKLVKEAKYRQEKGKHSFNARDKIVTVEEAWKQPDANPFGATNRIYTGPGRQMIKKQLERIVLDQYPTKATGSEISLSNILVELTELSRLHDPDKKGINFIISSHPYRVVQLDQNGNESYLSKPSPPGADRWIDPLTGKPIPTVTNSNPVVIKDLGSEVVVRITPTLHNVRLRDVLEAIEKCAECPQQPGFMGIKFSFEEFGVVCTQRIPETLHNRLFRVDPNTFIQGLESTQNIKPVPEKTNPNGAGGTGDFSSTSKLSTDNRSNTPVGAPYDPNLMASTSRPANRPPASHTIQDYVRQFFTTATGINFGGTSNTNTPGVNGNENSHPVRPMFFNDRTGVLFVRATTEELELVEQVFTALRLDFPNIAIDPFSALGQENKAPNGSIVTAYSSEKPTSQTYQKYEIFTTQRQASIKSSIAAINNKLDRLFISNFDKTLNHAMPLSEAVAALNETSKQLDPEKAGISFSIQTYEATDPVTSNRRNLGTQVMISPCQALTHPVSLRQAADIITQLASIPGLVFEARETGVVFKNDWPPHLENKLFKLDHEQLMRSLKSAKYDIATNNGSLTQDHVRGYFSKVTGISFGGNTNGVTLTNLAKTNWIRPLFYNDRTGALFVRATSEDLEALNRAVQEFVAPPRQINLKVRVFAIDASNLGVLDAYVQKTNSVAEPREPESQYELDRERILLSPIMAEELIGSFLKAEPNSEVFLDNSNVTTLENRPVTFAQGAGNFFLKVTPYSALKPLKINLSLNYGFLAENTKGQATKNPYYDESKPTQALDGKTLVYPGFKNHVLATRSGGLVKKVYVLCITPTEIDPAGNRVHAENEHP